MKRKKQRRGISLIVLVITIIIMIILASAVVISLNRSGMKEKSKDAVEKFDDKQLQELASIAWADAYAENVGKSTEELIPLLKESVEKALAENNLNKDDYGIYVTEKGVEIAKGWLQTSAQTVVKGDTTLEIGDYINYSDTANNGSRKYTGKWGVLGAEDGKLLIMTYEKVEVDGIEYNPENTLEGAIRDLPNFTTNINNRLGIFGKGTGAVGARLPKVEDITKILANYGTLKENMEIELDDGTTYNIKYGDELTYYWDTTELGAVCIEFPNGKILTETGLEALEQFVWYDGSEFHIEKAPTEVPSERQKICTIKTTTQNVSYDSNSRPLSKAEKFLGLGREWNCDFAGNPSSGWCKDGSIRSYLLDGEIWSFCGALGIYMLDGTLNSSYYSGGVVGIVTILYLNEWMSITSDETSDLSIVVELSPNITLSGSSDTSWNII